METAVSYVAIVIEIIGILIIVLGCVISLIRYLRSGDHFRRTSYENLRHELGRGILLGLEFLVAADIIDTVTTEPTMNKVLVLGVIVLIRTFLSLSIQVELMGKFPWQTEKAREKK